MLSDLGTAAAGRDDRHFAADLADERPGGGTPAGGHSGGVHQQQHQPGGVLSFHADVTAGTVPHSLCGTGTADDGESAPAGAAGADQHDRCG